MNWRRGIVLAAINLAVAVPLILLLEAQYAEAIRDHYVQSVERAKSTTSAPDHSPDAEITGTFNPCAMTSTYSGPERIVVDADLPAAILAGWNLDCPARWTLSGMLHAGGWLRPPTLAQQRKVDLGFALLIAIQWVLVGALPLRHPKRPWGEPGMFITLCAVLALAVVFIRPVREFAALFAGVALCAWFWWFGLLVWKLARAGWRWAFRHRPANA